MSVDTSDDRAAFEQLLAGIGIIAEARRKVVRFFFLTHLIVSLCFIAKSLLAFPLARGDFFNSHSGSRGTRSSPSSADFGKVTSTSCRVHREQLSRTRPSSMRKSLPCRDLPHGHRIKKFT
jgi:hypothetical protein